MARSLGQGEQRSRDYNDNLRYNNMRYAMLGMLRRPPPGFETIVSRHFFMVQGPLLLQCANWVSAIQ